VLGEQAQNVFLSSTASRRGLFETPASYATANEGSFLKGKEGPVTTHPISSDAEVKKSGATIPLPISLRSVQRKNFALFEYFLLFPS
jgi:hypothetical protein